jgi:rhamnogalacturonyl hydrolase YesR
MKEDTIKKRIKLAVDWLLNSGIQSASGYFTGWYDMDEGKYPFIYDEMIGYGIETFLFLYDQEKRSEYLDKATMAADWLIKHMKYRGDDPMAKGAFMWKYDLPDGPWDTNVYAFDTGICLSALVDLFRFTRKQRYLNSAISAADWLVNAMQNEDGSFKACYDPKSLSFGTGRWSKMPGSYHAKLSIGLLKLHKITGDERLKESMKNLCNWVLKLQDEDGKFKTNGNSEDVYVHAHCYAAEGLLYAGKELFDRRLRGAGIKAVNWLLSAQKPNGAIARWYERAYFNGGLSPDENTEALAQTIRLLLICNNDEHGTTNHRNPLSDKLEKALNRLLTMQHLGTGDKEATGGFYYAILDGELVPHINCCATLFSIQALKMCLDWKSGKFSPDYFLEWLV